MQEKIRVWGETHEGQPGAMITNDDMCEVCFIPAAKLFDVICALGLIQNSIQAHVHYPPEQEI